MSIRAAIPCTNGQAESLFGRHATLDARANGERVEAEHFAPVRGRERLSIQRRHRRVTSIAILLGRRGPSNVRRLVVAMRIRKTIERMLIAGSSSDISEKRLVYMPTFANADAKGAIVRKHLVVRVLASREHVRPCTVLRRLLAIRALSVTSRCFSAGNAHLSPQATTRLRSTRIQGRAANEFLGAAIATNARALLSRREAAQRFENFQSSEPSSILHPRSIDSESEEVNCVSAN